MRPSHGKLMSAKFCTGLGTFLRVLVRYVYLRTCTNVLYASTFREPIVRTYGGARAMYEKMDEMVE